MDFEEHRRIILNALPLLANFNLVVTNIPERKLEQLSEACASTHNEELYITKGIHQREQDPHILLKLKRGQTYYPGIHLALSEADVTGLSKRFQWDGVQFTAIEGNLRAEWPPVAPRNMQWRNDRLRKSIAPKDIKQARADLARKQQEEQEKANRAAQAAQAEANKNEAIRRIKEQLPRKGWKIVGTPNIVDRAVNKLATGGKVEVKTAKGQQMVKFEGGELKTC
jgi:hypothetical protein